MTWLWFYAYNIPFASSSSTMSPMVSFWKMQNIINSTMTFHNLQKQRVFRICSLPTSTRMSFQFPQHLSLYFKLHQFGGALAMGTVDCLPHSHSDYHLPRSFKEGPLSPNCIIHDIPWLHNWSRVDRQTDGMWLCGGVFLILHLAWCE